MLPGATEVSRSHTSAHNVCSAFLTWQWWQTFHGQQEIKPQCAKHFSSLCLHLFANTLLAKARPKAGSVWEGSSLGLRDRGRNNLGPFFEIAHDRCFNIEISGLYWKTQCGCSGSPSSHCSHGPAHSNVAPCQPSTESTFPAPRPLSLIYMCGLQPWRFLGRTPTSGIAQCKVTRVFRKLLWLSIT